MPRPTKKHRRIFRIAIKVLFAGAFIAGGALFLLAQTRPAWYTPIKINQGDLPTLRRDVTIQLDDISRKIVQKKPFTITWSQDQLTKRLAAFPDIWPDSKNAWPPELSDPVVKIENGTIRLGAFFERAGWRAIVGLKLKLEVIPKGDVATNQNGPNSLDKTNSASASVTTNQSARFAPEHLRLTLIEATTGSLTAPRWLLKKWFNDQLKDLEVLPTVTNEVISKETTPAQSATIDQLFKGIRIQNNFTWPNGKRPFKITKIETTSGTVTLHIQPT